MSETDYIKFLRSKADRDGLTYINSSRAYEGVLINENLGRWGGHILEGKETVTERYIDKDGNRVVIKIFYEDNTTSGYYKLKIVNYLTYTPQIYFNGDRMIINLEEEGKPLIPSKPPEDQIIKEEKLYQSTATGSEKLLMSKILKVRYEGDKEIIHESIIEEDK